ncbi:unnamed protein product [Vitrella brassicaformis CCMP3155]|uniref:Uncharacterized protein n=2 Tax=Vitrella brassicaformis TaxID=1169539 RepID=A0A0G4GLN4_VITBC|nr:unnamed protein product [Vitrella brassicaformis CCMP3155]|eukprot:CEM31029.1 unnamed protein product [Vitrella brassicaformis CCMP3155]
MKQTIHNVEGALSQSDTAVLTEQSQKLNATLANTERRIKADPGHLEDDEIITYASAALSFNAISKAIGSGGFNKRPVDESAVVRASQEGHDDIVVMVWPQEAVKLSSLVRAARAGQVYELSYHSEITHRTHRIFLTDKDVNNTRGVANDQQGPLRRVGQQAEKLGASLAQTELAIHKDENHLTNNDTKKSEYAKAAFELHSLFVALGIDKDFKLTRVTGSTVMAAVRGDTQHNDIVVFTWPQAAIA